MNMSLLYQTPVYTIVIILFVLMLLFNRIGFGLRKNQVSKNSENVSEGLGPVEGSLLGLLALLLSFTFGMSASRYDIRRQAIVQESNDIGTAILRCDLYNDSVKSALRNDFKGYLNARIAYYDSGTDETKIDAALKDADAHSAKIWATVVQQSTNKENTLQSQQMIPAVNAMIDVVTTVETNRSATVPDSIVWFLFLLILTSSLIVGYSSSYKKINYVIVCGFALMTVLTVFLILDLDRPRRGIINTSASVEKVAALKGMLNN